MHSTHQRTSVAGLLAAVVLMPGMFDNQLLERAANEAVKTHLRETRGSVAKHLAAAKELQAGATR
jgi:hypothetical protein